MTSRWWCRIRPTCASSTRSPSARARAPDKVFLTVQKYGNMSAATAPVALVEAVEEGRVPPGSLVLMPAFGGGLTLSAHLIRWGERMTPLERERRRTAAANQDRARHCQRNPRSEEVGRGRSGALQNLELPGESHRLDRPSALVGGDQPCGKPRRQIFLHVDAR